EVIDSSGCHNLAVRLQRHGVGPGTAVLSEAGSHFPRAAKGRVQGAMGAVAHQGKGPEAIGDVSGPSSDYNLAVRLQRHGVGPGTAVLSEAGSHFPRAAKGRVQSSMGAVAH